MSKHPLANLSDTTCCIPEMLAKVLSRITSLSDAHNEALLFSTVQNQPRQIHQWLGPSHLYVPRSRCGVRLPLALLCVWGAQESLTLHLWGGAYNNLCRYCPQHVSRVQTASLATHVLFCDYSTPALYPCEFHFLFSVS